MYPDLSYFLHDLFGTPYDNWASVFKTFGLFMTLAFLCSALVFYFELKRKADDQTFIPREKITTIGKGTSSLDLLLNVILGFLLCFKTAYIIEHSSSFNANPIEIILSWKGNFWIGILGSIVCGTFYYFMANKDKETEPRKVRQHIYPHHRVGEITIVAAISGILGAKIFAILENFSAFVERPLETFFSGSGLTIYGGLILGFIVVYGLIKILGYKPIHVMDAVAPALIIGYMVGRMGCHFSGDGDWGIAAGVQPNWWFLPDWLWAYSYPHNVADFYQKGPKLENCSALFCTYLDPKVYPTPLYEIAMCTLMFGVVWFLRKRLKVPGTLFFTYVLLNGVERFIIEKIRVNDKYEILGLDWSLSGYIAFILFLIGLTGIIYLNRFHKTPNNEV